jgi:hypothetical protein
MTTDIETELELKQRNLILEVFRNHQDMCLDDLLATFEEDAQEFLRTIPISVLIGETNYEEWETSQQLHAASSPPTESQKTRKKRHRKKAPVPPPKKRTTSRPSSDSTAAVENAVYSFCKKNSPCQASDIIEATQISKSQLRTAAKKLITAGKLFLEGAGRGAKYTAAA